MAVLLQPERAWTVSPFVKALCCVNLGGLLGLLLAGCEDDTTPKPVTEQRLNIGFGMNSKIIVLPTGERVLLITGGDGLATCCLLPPIQPQKVER